MGRGGGRRGKCVSGVSKMLISLKLGERPLRYKSYENNYVPPMCLTYEFIIPIPINREELA